MKKFFKKFSQFGFWVSLSGAVILLVNSLGKAFGFSVDNEIIDSVIMSFAGVLVVLGFVVKPESEKDENSENDEDKNNKNDE